jgi:DNA gyrase inhibitor GyrI
MECSLTVDTGDMHANVQELIGEWRKAADYCLTNEPFLFHYEVARSDKDPV